MREEKDGNYITKVPCWTLGSGCSAMWRMMMIDRVVYTTNCISNIFYKYNCPLFHSGAPGAGEREAELLLLQVQPQTDVHQGAEGPAVGVPAAPAADIHHLPADPPAEACHGAGQPPHPYPLPEDRAQLQGRPLAKY